MCEELKVMALHSHNINTHTSAKVYAIATACYPVDNYVIILEVWYGASIFIAHVCK